MKWVKRLLLLIALALIGVIIFGVVSFWMVNRQPEWYQARKLTTQQAADAARSMEDKLNLLRNWAQEANPPTFKLTLTPAELESFSAKWASQWKDKYESVLADPQLFIHDSKLILAGRLKERKILASLHFSPRLDASGKLDPNLVQIRGGTLPLPEAIFDKPKAKAIASLEAKQPAWIKASKLNRNGTTNDALTSVGLSDVALALLKHGTCDPYLYIPVDGRTAVPTRIRAVSVTDEALTIEAEILSAEERAKLLEQVKKKAR